MASRTSKKTDPDAAKATTLASEETESAVEPEAAKEAENEQRAQDETTVDAPEQATDSAQEDDELEEPEKAQDTAKKTDVEQSPDLEPSAFEVPEETAPAEQGPDPGDAPLADFIILSGPASFGPVTINGQSVRCRKDVLYQVPNVAERATILGTGRFRAATKKDQARAGKPSAGPGGAVTRDLLPPGALKGGLMQS